MAGVDWGSVPDWVQGVGGVVALVFAAWAVRLSMATNAQQARQIEALERAEEERGREVQARYAANVVCWITLLPAERDSRVTVRIVNSNEGPIYDVAVYVGTDAGSSRSDYRQVGPTTPGHKQYLGRPARALNSLLPPYEDGRQVLYSTTMWVAATFRDPNDRWWIRDPDGRLHRAGTGPEAAQRCSEILVGLRTAADG